jgi:hypothetical protein
MKPTADPPNYEEEFEEEVKAQIYWNHPTMNFMFVDFMPSFSFPWHVSQQVARVARSIHRNATQIAT